MKEKIKELLEVRKSSRAKRAKLRYRKGRFEAVIPEGLDPDVDHLIRNNLEWFQSYLEEAYSYREQVPERSFDEGEKIDVLGSEREIVIEKRRSNSVDEDIYLAEHLVDRTSVKDQLKKALKDKSREVFEIKASKYSDQVENDFEQIFIRDQKTRWGSCSSKNNLNFNWRLILAPEHVLEYVVVHEIVHLDVSNHSDEFWKRVQQIYPNYADSKAWLENNSALLEFDY